jgi:hypothetical protein
METIEIAGDTIYLKKSKVFGWGIVYPHRIEGKINWKNLLAGRSWWDLVFIIILVTVISGAIFEYSNVVRLANECLNNNFYRIIP